MAVPCARYFITAVSEKRREGLACFRVWAKLLELASLNEADVWGMVLMPDHFHALFVLPDTNTPSDVVRALKGPATPTLRDLGLAWQRNYFEHRLRSVEESEPYLRYMLANPYRAGIADIGVRWPFWSVISPNARWFIEKFPKQIPEPEWLDIEQPWETYGS
ncbi:MAG: transposase [Opitutales bacterium]